MATVTGESGVVRFEASDSSVAIVGAVRSFELALETQAIESTVMGSSGRQYKPGLEQFTASVDMYFDNDNAVQMEMLDAIGSDTGASFELYPSGEGSGNAKFAGNVIVTNFTVTSNFDGMVEATAEFQGIGTITRTNVA